MNIAVVSHGAAGGGSERVASILANHFAEKNNVFFYAIHSPKKEYYLDSRLSYYYGGVEGHNKIVKYLKRTMRLRKFLRMNNIDIMVSFIYGEGFATYRNRKLRKVYSLRNDPNQEKKFDLFGIKKLYKDADLVVFQTEDAKNFFNKSITEHGVVIPNPIKSGLPKWNMEGTKKVIIAAGRLHPQKNFAMLLRAFSDFSTSHPEYELLLCGDGELRDELMNLSISLGIAGKVNFLGHISNLHERMSNAAIYVSSSDFEGISNSMLEALAIGVPSVCTDCPIGGARMFIDDGINGFLVPVGDYRALSEKLSYIADNQNEMEVISANAQKINELLNEEYICEKWEKAILG